ncbi:MAG TPA: hypothetical protein VK983_05275, partial [Candidatus Limnocylindrales bacterium]|nr:hypothetical protein [Candidatus Limnocylindrales bacterium]
DSAKAKPQAEQTSSPAEPPPFPQLESLAQPQDEPSVLSGRLDQAALRSADAGPTHELPADQPPEAEARAQNAQTLSELERLVVSPHAQVEDVDSARRAVEDALKEQSSDASLEPLVALNAQPVDLDLGHDEPKQPETEQPPFQAEQPQIPENHVGQDITSQIAAAEPAPEPNFGLQPLGGQPDYSIPPQPFPSPTSQLSNEPAPLTMSPADQPFTMPLPPSVNVAGPQVIPPTSTGLPPQGPPPPPTPPPMPPNFGGQGFGS